MLLFNWLTCNFDWKMAGIKSNCAETADRLADGFVCLCQSYRSISITPTLFHKQLKNLVVAVSCSREAQLTDRRMCDTQV